MSMRRYVQPGTALLSGHDDASEASLPGSSILRDEAHNRCIQEFQRSHESGLASYGVIFHVLLDRLAMPHMLVALQRDPALRFWWLR